LNRIEHVSVDTLIHPLAHHRCKYQGEVNVAKVDVTKAPGCGTRFNVRAFPSLKFFHQVRLTGAARMVIHHTHTHFN
jgi:thioredoxin-like negative regulator of GroEL